ncbi:hypothetical protein [Mesorhizobium sp. M7A.F.Ca.ET.027.02.1.1]|uniref:hypothetical protein n=1 Tax=Mesorhizobium sp. M7A.F.Ca.ET.027.02.1.1 TaxID=2496655 RepID=UPI001AECE901|nr:hypothetical protein [Mesorhizobium sp. M7A.F.Ca.ET.027.02.1.1]
MLAQHHPRSFISGNKISLGAVLKEYNRNEFHHIYPRSFIKSKPNLGEYEESCLANMCFLSRTDNNAISGAAPSEYRAKMPDDVEAILESNLIPADIFEDKYSIFLIERSGLLYAAANKLLEETEGVFS